MDLKKIKQSLKDISPWPWTQKNLWDDDQDHEEPEYEVVSLEIDTGDHFKATKEIVRQETICSNQQYYPAATSLKNQKFISKSPQIISDLLDLVEECWRPIESAPKDGTFVDLWIEHPGFGKRYTDMCYCDGDWINRDGLYKPSKSDSIPYWMPLPEPPK